MKLPVLAELNAIGLRGAADQVTQILCARLADRRRQSGRQQRGRDYRVTDRLRPALSRVSRP